MRDTAGVRRATRAPAAASSAGSRPTATASPAATRPVGRRPPAGDGGAAARTSPPRPPGRFTARAVVLGVVLLALLLSSVYPVRVYLAQRAQIVALEASQEVQRAHIEELAAEVARWEDEDYIRIQARQRLYFAEPGEMLLITVREDEAPPPAGGPDPDTAPAPAGAWWETLWASVTAANGR